MMTPLTSVFVIDPPERLDPPTDTTLALMRESLRRGQQVFYCTLADMLLDGGRPTAYVRPVTFPPQGELFSAGPPERLDLAAADVLYLRKDPPVDLAYLHATYILDRLPPHVVQINPARALRDHCEKLIPLHFPELFPETVITCDPEELVAFLERVDHIVIKPLGDCSGRGVIELHHGIEGWEARCSEATEKGRRYVQGQRFLPEIIGGDKRVLLLGGEILGWVRRLPAAGEFRSNVNAGGRCVSCELNAGERAVCERLRPWLVAEGIHLAGADLVDGRLLEVNITSPSCLREIDALTGAQLERRIVAYAEGLCRR